MNCKKNIFFTLFLAFASPLAVHGKTNSAIGIYEDTYVMQTATNQINQAVYDEAYDNKVDGLNNSEVKFQFSLSAPLYGKGRHALMLSYTQLSLWQLGNTQASSPFRETNYKPQIFMMHQGNWFAFNNIEYGYRHQSNGGEINITRSWDRAFITLERVNERVIYGIQWWHVLKDSENPDISDFIPPYELSFGYNGSLLSWKVKGAYNFETDKGQAELGASIPLNQFLDIYAQVFTGYGESLIDYNYDQTRVGLGLKLIPGAIR